MTAENWIGLASALIAGLGFIISIWVIAGNSRVRREELFLKLLEKAARNKIEAIAINQAIRQVQEEIKFINGPQPLKDAVDNIDKAVVKDMLDSSSQVLDSLIESQEKINTKTLLKMACSLDRTYSNIAGTAEPLKARLDRAIESHKETSG